MSLYENRRGNEGGTLRYGRVVEREYLLKQEGLLFVGLRLLRKVVGFGGKGGECH